MAIENAGPAEWLARACASLSASYPNEGCGLVVEDGNGLRFVACNNLVRGHAARTAYQLDPLELIRAEARGEHVVAIVHSHCDADDDFSRADEDAALMSDGPCETRAPAFPNVGYLVVSIDADGPRRASLHRYSPQPSGRFQRTWTRTFR